MSWAEDNGIDAYDDSSCDCNQQDESYWAKVYAGQIAAGLFANPCADVNCSKAFIADTARALAKEMCREDK